MLKVLSDSNVVFDFDGTLNHFRETIFHSFKDACERVYKVPFVFDSVETFLDRELSGEVALNAMLKETGLEGVDLFEFVLHSKPYYLANEKIRFWVPPMLAELNRQGRRALICSNNDEPSARYVLGIAQHDIHHFSCMNGHPKSVYKPDPRAYQLFLDESGINPAKAVYVTDEKLDACGARLAGFGKVIVVPWGLSNAHHLKEVAQANFQIVSTPAELFAELKIEMAIPEVEELY
jgi:phosphoglycolate phosphatase-like HAD superfamily hydrolase